MSKQDKATKTGETRWAQGASQGLQEEVPAQPTERDESASSQQSASDLIDEKGKQAHHDAAGPITDTDRGPVMDKVYNESVTDGHRSNDGETAGGERDPQKSTSSRHP